MVFPSGLFLYLFISYLLPIAHSPPTSCLNAWCRPVEARPLTMPARMVPASMAGQLAQQAVTDTKLEELTREVREHNNFARRVPVMEEQIKVINHRIADLETAGKD